MRSGLPALASLLLPVAAAAQVWVGLPPEPGRAVVLSNFESGATPVLLIAPPAPAPVADAASPPPAPAAMPPTSFAALIEDAAQRARVSPLLVHAIIATESAFDPNAVSHKGALGLMQLLPQTASRFGVARPLDPRENLHGGTQYLRWLADRFGGRLELVLAAYNAGEGSVVRSGYRVPDIAETRAYVRSVMRRVQCSAVDRCMPAPA